jgi:UDP-N-acetylmuramate dehydrogenase
MIREYINHPLRERNSFHVEESAARIVEFDDKADLDTLFAEDNTPEKWYVLGGGNNILFTQHYDGTLIHPTGKKTKVLSDDSSALLVEVEAGMDWDKFVCWCVERGVWGAENLSLIPGTVGAAPVQNIGAYGTEAKDIIHAVHYFDTQLREHRTLTNKECRFAYRDSIFKQELRGRAIVTSVEFCLSKIPQPNLGYGDLIRETEARGEASLQNIRDAVCAIRQGKLPDTAVLGNAGSFFKNPIIPREDAEQMQAQYENMPIYPTADDNKRKLAAGWLIDQAGMKGYRNGNVGVHDRQALVLVNYGGATGCEVINLSKEVQLRVKEKFGIAIEPEVNIL